ncbi:sulfide/dihydroorotate dehydrogenase-like FAD/NAD-binding protein [Liberiplasma polymorphum]|uniref:sulfide/dihydroorotate dehydrogenase-like FAD/NAD-binding protein n=1 Tax=Liberiplasma polymorphum TaxID=3374570 RepID=UPI0037762C3E
MYEIVEKKVLNKDIDLMSIKAPLVARNAKPGHFIILRVDKDGERIPLTIADIDGDNVIIIYQKLGYSTAQLGLKEAKDTIEDFVGPLGKAAHIRDVKHVIGVAGGVGSAPLLPQLKAYKEAGIKVELILGARSKDYLILKEEYASFCDLITITTDDGSEGTKGLVTHALEARLKEAPSIDHVIAIGPVIMMKYVALMAKQYEKSIDVSLNPIMIDGTGMCGNCRVSIGGKTFFACIDGPDFPGEEVDFDELMARQNYYKDEEHLCNIGLKK